MSQTVSTSYSHSHSQSSGYSSSTQFKMILNVLLLLGIPIVLARTKTGRALNERSFSGDPRRNITCLGKQYDLQLPLRPDGSDPNELTMQQLCAKTEYGGAPNGSHFGGWCSKGLRVKFKDDPSDSESDLEDVLDDGRTRFFWDTTGVSFDHSPYSGADVELGDPRFLLGCYNRCFCNYGVTDLTIQPERAEPSDADNQEHYSGSTGEIRLDITNINDLRTAEPQNDGRLGGVEVESVSLTELIEPNEQEGFAFETRHEFQHGSLSLDAGNYITCEGDLPTFPLPQPYPVSAFKDPQELCAVQWSGGKSGANAGGYCHRSNPRGALGDYRAYDNYVWFSDEMTPRYEYTWGGGNFGLAASLRTYCYAHCWCSSVGKKHTSRRKWIVWQVLRNHQLILHSDGSTDYGRRGPLNNDVFRKLGTVLPTQNSSGGPGKGTAGTCGSDGKQFCPMPWPEEQLGPIPRAPPFSTEILAPIRPPATGSKKDLTVCGNRCSSNSECHSSLDYYACDCAFPNAEDAHTLGLDPVSPPSICLSLNKLVFGIHSKRDMEEVDETGGRDEVEMAPRYSYVDERGGPYQCRCNSTYTGNECCGVKDGVV